MIMKHLQALLLCTLVSSAVACGDSQLEDAGPRPDAAREDAGTRDLGRPDAAIRDASSEDAGVIVDGGRDAGPGPSDAGAVDAASTDADSSDTGSPDTGSPDASIEYNCGLFSTDPGWTVSPGFRAVEIASAADGLSQPVALHFAGGSYGDRLYVVDQGNEQLFSLDVLSGDLRVVVTSTSWTQTPGLLTTITWDQDGVFDGRLYVGDQGGDGDSDSRIYRVEASGAVSIFTAAPGAGLDDIYAMAFGQGAGYTAGLYVAGDTDGAGPDWGRFDSAGLGVAFSEVAGIEGAIFDRSGLYGGALIAARPLGGGYAGDGTLSIILPNGTLGSTLAQGLGGVHAPAMSSGGAFGNSLYAASWSTGRLYRIDASGPVEVASGLSLTNYDGNILEFSPDGNVLFVADRLASRVVCIEPSP